MGFDYDVNLIFMVFMRLSGCILFHPIFGRKNIPTMLRIGLCMMLTFFLYPLVPEQKLYFSSFIVLFVCAAKELLIGFLIGLITQMFLSVLIMGGELADMQIGISMSKVYDPQSNVSMPMSASIVNAMFYLIFFGTNAHLTLIKMFVKLCETVPYGDAPIAPGIFGNLTALFSLILIYAVKMSLPILAAEMITEIAVGLIMRAVPQIDVFVINIQMKLIIGFLILLILAPSFAVFLEKLIEGMFGQINMLFAALA
ncbi:MAG: flagellar biosynthetic protein FliR [Bacillota bacterium]|nr:flagellar biosynthetic protein FliR [Bacillota bacterium]